jgi:hypothetical protein
VKHFVFQVKDIRMDRSGNTTKEVKGWQIKNNTLHFIGKRQFTYEDNVQSFHNLLMAQPKGKYLPWRILTEKHSNGMNKFHAVDLKNNGICDIQEIV